VGLIPRLECIFAGWIRFAHHHPCGAKVSKQEELYLEIGSGLKEAEKSQMFGKPCFKINGKAFVCFFQDAMVFKLTGESHANALALKGSKLFDPSGSKRPMKEWVQVNFENRKAWIGFAKDAIKYVKESSS
jgi:hypothetical protein